MASEEPEGEPVGLVSTVYEYTVFVGVLTWIIYLIWRKLRQQGLTDKLESDLLVKLSQQIIKVCSVCEKLLPFHSSQQCKCCSSAICAECCIEQQCSTCYLDKSTSSLLRSPEFQSVLRSKLETNLATLDNAPNGGRGENSEVRDLMEKLVESLVEEQLDDTPITPLSSHPAYKPVVPSETTGAVQNQLKSLIVQVLREANSLPTIQFHSTQDSSNVESLKSKTYEDILATTILNKIVEKCQHSKTVTSASEDRDSSGAPLKSVNTSVKATCEFKLGPPECASGREYQDGARDKVPEQVWNKGRTSLLCTTVEHIEEVITRYSPNEYEREEKQPLTDAEDKSRNMHGLYGVTYGGRDSHRAPCPELGRDIVDGSALLEDGYDSDSSVHIGIEFINDLETWEENWLFSKKKAVVPNPRAAAHHPVPVPMLVPCPGPDQTCRTLIGDMDAEETSDLSECSDSMYDDPIFTSKTPSRRVEGSESSSLRVGGSSSSEEDEDYTEAWVEARNEKLLLLTPLDSGEGSLEVTEEESAHPLPNDATIPTSSTHARPVPKPRKTTVSHSKNQTTKGLREKPPTGITKKKQSNSSEMKTNHAAPKANDIKTTTENFLETERNTSPTDIEAELDKNLDENSTHRCDTTNIKSSQNTNGTIPNKTVESVINTVSVTENNQNREVPGEESANNSFSSKDDGIENERVGKSNQPNKQSPIENKHNQIQQTHNNSGDNERTNTKDQTNVVNDKPNGACEVKTEQTKANHTELNIEETAKPNSQTRAANSKKIEEKASKKTKNPDIKQTIKAVNNVHKEPANGQIEPAKAMNGKECVTESDEETNGSNSNPEENNTLKENKEVPMVVQDSKLLHELEETIAKESYDREHEAELAEIEILNTPPKPGTIAEREHAKWQRAVPMENNPYSKENIEKRNRLRLFDLSRSASSDQTESNDETDHSRQESIIVTSTSSPDLIKRYSRDYYINNSCGTPSSHLSSSTTSLSSIGKGPAHSIRPEALSASKGLPQSQKRSERRSKDLDDLKRPPNVSSEDSSDESTCVLDRNSDPEDNVKYIKSADNAENANNSLQKNVEGVVPDADCRTTVETIKIEDMNSRNDLYESNRVVYRINHDETKNSKTGGDVSPVSTMCKNDSLNRTDTEVIKENKEENYSLSMDDTGFSDIKTIQSTQNDFENENTLQLSESASVNNENVQICIDNRSLNPINTNQNYVMDNKTSQSLKKNSLVDKCASQSDLLELRKNDPKYISTQTLPNQTLREDGKSAKKKSKNLFASIKKFLTKKKSKSISKCESSQSLWFTDKSLQNIYSDTWNQKQQEQMKRESFDDELLENFRKTKLEQIENFIRTEQGAQVLNNFDYLKNMSDETSSTEEGMVETLTEEAMDTASGSHEFRKMSKVDNIVDESAEDKTYTEISDNTTLKEPIMSTKLEIDVTKETKEIKVTPDNINKSNSSTLERRQNTNSQPIQVVLDKTEHPCGDIIVHDVDSDNGIDDFESVETSQESSPEIKRYINEIEYNANEEDELMEIAGTSQRPIGNTITNDKTNDYNEEFDHKLQLDSKKCNVVEISDQERASIIKEIDQIFEQEGLNITFDNSTTGHDETKNILNETLERTIRLSNNFSLPHNLDKSILQKKQEQMHERNIQRNKTKTAGQEVKTNNLSNYSESEIDEKDRKAIETKNKLSVENDKNIDEITEITEKITDKFDVEKIDMQKSFLVPVDLFVNSKSNEYVESFSDKLAGSLEEYVLRNSLLHKTLKPKNSSSTANFSVNPLYINHQDNEDTINDSNEKGKQTNGNVESIPEAQKTRSSTPENSFLDAEYSFHLRKTPESGYSSTVETVRGTTPDMTNELRKVSECEEILVQSVCELDKDVLKVEAHNETIENPEKIDGKSVEKYSDKIDSESFAHIKSEGMNGKQCDNSVLPKTTANAISDSDEGTCVKSTTTNKLLLEPGNILDERIILERRNILNRRSPIPSPRTIRGNKVNNLEQGNVSKEGSNASLEIVEHKENRGYITPEKDNAHEGPTDLGGQLSAEFDKLTRVFSKSVENLDKDNYNNDNSTETKLSIDEISKQSDESDHKRLSSATIVPYDHLKQLCNAQNNSNFNTRL